MVQYRRSEKGEFPMVRRIKEIFSREMVRPLIYQISTRGVLALFVAQLAHFFAPAASGFSSFSNLSLGLGLLFVLFAFLAWLRTDGIRIPQLKLPRMKKKDPPFLARDMADHIDDDIVSFDDLDQEEQDLCVFLADCFLAAVCLILTAIV